MKSSFSFSVNYLELPAKLSANLGNIYTSRCTQLLPPATMQKWQRYPLDHFSRGILKWIDFPQRKHFPVPGAVNGLWRWHSLPMDRSSLRSTIWPHIMQQSTLRPTSWPKSRCPNSQNWQIITSEINLEFPNVGCLHLNGCNKANKDICYGVMLLWDV